MDLGLADKVVLVTGGSRGIGRAIALSFAREGAKVAITGRERESLDRTLAELDALGNGARALVSDVRDAQACKAVVDEVAQAFGRLDIVVNNAAGPGYGNFMELDDQQLLGRFHGKALGAMRVSRAAVPHLRAVGGGRIICVGGTAARQVLPGAMPSGIANAALVNFAKHLAEEVGPFGILVNVVHPSLTRTSTWPTLVRQRRQRTGESEQAAEAAMASVNPIGRIVEPEDVASLVVFLASARASAISGQAIGVDGGSMRAVLY